jgi:hypothetical protein
VTRIWPLEAGHQVRIATGLPSAAGPGGGGAFITVGLGPDPANEHLVWAMSGVKFGWLVKMSASGHWKPRVDIARHEARKNPDGEVVDSNPYGVLALPGRQVVADAGGNTLLEVSANGRVKTLAVFPRRSAGGASFQAVPTAVAQGPDRAFYVGQLTGVPFPVGEACVYRVPECGGQPTCLYGGFTNIIDVAFGPSVSPGGGQVVRVRP